MEVGQAHALVGGALQRRINAFRRCYRLLLIYIVSHRHEGQPPRRCQPAAAQYLRGSMDMDMDDDVYLSAFYWATAKRRCNIRKTLQNS